MLAELRATSEIIGSPPRSPDKTLPAPTATKSLLGLEILFHGSRPSIALTVRTDSRLLTNKNIATYFQNTNDPMAEKSALKFTASQKLPILTISNAGSVCLKSIIQAIGIVINSTIIGAGTFL